MARAKKNRKGQKHPKPHYGKKQAATPRKTPQTVGKPHQNPQMMQQTVKLGSIDGKATLVFNATDTLFFRESRPMEAMGELQSVFPPPMRTLAGALRALIGESQCVDWQAYSREESHPLREQMGFGEDLGQLKLQGVWLSRVDEHGKPERLYPAPLHLMKKDQQLYGLQIDKAITRCDLGNIRLPTLADDNARGSKPLENHWLTHSALEKVLQGKLPEPHESISTDDLISRESRLGIALEQHSRTVKQSLLYQTRHIRPKDTRLRIEVDAAGLPATLPEQAMVRLGGEGRSASLQLEQTTPTFPQAPQAKQGDGILLYLLTPLLQRHTPANAANLPHFQAQEITLGEQEKQTVWQGELHGIELELHSVVSGKAHREGGWDLAQHKPRAVESLTPAGSVFFCKVRNATTQEAIQHAINTLHNQHIGDLKAYGYGHLAVGIWKD